MSRPHSERDGDCICDYNPTTIDGPDECCPFHGRPYAYWIERGDALQERAELAEAGIHLLRKVRDYWDGRPLTHHGDHIYADLLDVLRAIEPAPIDPTSPAAYAWCDDPDCGKPRLCGVCQTLAMEDDARAEERRRG